MTSLPVHCLVTPSHEVLLRDWFLRTLPSDLEPVVHRREAQPVEFAQDHWHEVVGQKLDILLDALIATTDGDVLLMSDVDVAFYTPVMEDVVRQMADRDILFQNNRPSLPEGVEHLCSGFMVVRATARSVAFVAAARDLLRAANDPRVGDQRACIEVLRSRPGMVRWGFLPTTYWSPGDPRGRWTPGMSLSPPDGIVLHHANHTVGVANKIAQLRLVAELIAPRGTGGGATG
jgi:hypothetical protein